MAKLKKLIEETSFWEKISTAEIVEWSKLAGLNIAVAARSLCEFFKTAIRYYPNKRFLKADLAMKLMYLFNHPFSISKRFLRERGDIDLYTYGETPLTTMEKICKECKITPSDCFYDLGSGKGQLCFWVHYFIGCPTVGIEEIPDFIERSNQIKQKVKADGVTFKLADYKRCNLQGGTVFYLYGSNLEEEAIKSIIKQIQELPSGTRVITVSYPLSDYCAAETFVTMKRFTGKFQWGSADIYLQVKR